MSNQLWQRKPVEHFEREMKESKLKRVLGKWGLTSLGVGAIIGAGIFVMTGVGAKEYAGPALALSFIVAGIGCTFAALCYAEFASFLPVEGSAYAYSYATMGELFAWIIGWDLVLEYGVGTIAVAVSWSGYFTGLLHSVGVNLPPWTTFDFRTAMQGFQKASGLLRAEAVWRAEPDRARCVLRRTCARGNIFRLRDWLRARARVGSRCSKPRLRQGSRAPGRSRQQPPGLRRGRDEKLARWDRRHRLDREKLRVPGGSPGPTRPGSSPDSAALPPAIARAATRSDGRRRIRSSSSGAD